MKVFKSSLPLAFSIIALMILPLQAHAIFDENGKFEETWDFSWIGSDEVPAGRWDFWASGSYTVKNGEYSQTTPAAKNPLSSGANGLRLWYVDSTGSPGAASSSPSSPLLHFGEPQKELWIRFYTRYQEGFRWWEGGNPNYDKILRLWTKHGAYPNIYMIMIASSRAGIYPEYWNNPPRNSDWVTNERGWNNIFGDGNNLSHGEWVCLEMHVRMESSVGADDGMARMWIDGELILDIKDAGYVDVEREDAEERMTGWVHMAMSNQDFVQNEIGPIGRNVAYVDYDDFVIYNQTPPNTDEHGNPFIGPLDWNGAKPITPPSLLRLEGRDARGAASPSPLPGAISRFGDPATLPHGPLPGMLRRSVESACQGRAWRREVYLQASSIGAASRMRGPSQAGRGEAVKPACPLVEAPTDVPS